MNPTTETQPTQPAASGRLLAQMQQVSKLLLDDEPFEAALHVSGWLLAAAMSGDQRMLAQMVCFAVHHLATTFSRPDGLRILRTYRRGGRDEVDALLAMGQTFRAREQEWSRQRTERPARAATRTPARTRRRRRAADVDDAQRDRWHLTMVLSRPGTVGHLERLAPFYPRYHAAFAACLDLARSVEGLCLDPSAARWHGQGAERRRTSAALLVAQPGLVEALDQVRAEHRSAAARASLDQLAQLACMFNRYMERAPSTT